MDAQREHSVEHIDPVDRDSQVEIVPGRDERGLGPHTGDPGASAGGDRRPLREERTISAFRKVPRTGVIYVTTEAARLGFKPGADAGEDGWCNLGQSGRGL